MSDFFGAAVGLAEYVIGTQTNTSTSGTGTSNINTNSYTDVVGTSSSDTKTLTGTATTNVTDTTTGSETDTNSSTSDSHTVQNSTDPGVVAMLRSLAQSAINNSTDPSKTTGILSGIIQQAGDAMTSIFGAVRNSGLYNSASGLSQTNDVLSRAGADAASAILGYQTGQQNIADTALNQLGGFLSSITTTDNSSTSGKSVTSGFTNTTSATAQATGSDTSTNTVQELGTHVVGQTINTSQSQQQSSQSKGMSVVCTWMHRNSLLSTRKYAIATDDLGRMPWYVRKGYFTFAGPLVSILEKDHTNRISRAIISLFTARTNQICALRDKRGGCKKSLYGAFARLVIASLCFPFCLFFLLIHMKNFLIGKDPTYGTEVV